MYQFAIKEHSSKKTAYCFIAMLAIALRLLIPAHAMASTTPGELYQSLRLGWSNDNWKGHSQVDFQIPGIGSGNVQCSPNTTWIQMKPNNTDAETDMWTVKTENKSDGVETSVKNARIYQFSTPTSSQTVGSGRNAYEGFNQQTPVENSSSGHLIGLISTRQALNQYETNGGQPTSIELSWKWSNFGTSKASCLVKATFITGTSGSYKEVIDGSNSNLPKNIGNSLPLNLNWNGSYATSQPQTNSVVIPDLATLTTSCQDSADSIADLTLSGVTGNPLVSVTTFTVLTISPSAGAPTSQDTSILLSSYYINNNPNTASDYCEIAAQIVNPYMS
jgi:hypothetical protein